MKQQHVNGPERFAILASDVVLFTVKEKKLLVRLIDVDRPPFYEHVPGLPGGLIDATETAEEAARRHVALKGGVVADKLYVEQFHTFSRVDRDPRNRVVAVGHLALTPWENLSDEEQLSGVGMRWLPVEDCRVLAYDHSEMLIAALEHLRMRVRSTTIAKKLIPKEFTLTDLEEVYESILGTSLDKRNFRKKILALDVLKELPDKKRKGKFRPAQLYSFRSSQIETVA